MSKLAVSVAGVAATAFIVVAAVGSAASVSRYSATLTTGAEVPRPAGAAGAKGLFTATISESGSTRTLAWKLTFSRLSGKATAAHIHKGKAGAAGGVLAPLCGPCASGKTGKLKVSAATAKLLQGGGAYVNVHTAKNAAGEIRGQVKLLGALGTPPPAQPDPSPTPPSPPPSYEPPPGY